MHRGSGARPPRGQRRQRQGSVVCAGVVLRAGGGRVRGGTHGDSSVVRHRARERIERRVGVGTRRAAALCVFAEGGARLLAGLTLSSPLFALIIDAVPRVRLSWIHAGDWQKRPIGRAGRGLMDRHLIAARPPLLTVCLAGAGRS
eukprot:7071202-Prymnesium_polylepis.1